MRHIPILPAIIFLVTFTFASFFARIDVDPLHDGIMFKTAYDVASGKTLYTQTYTHYGIVTAWIQSVALHVLGVRLISIRIVTALFYGFCSVFLWLTWSRFLSYRLTALSILIWLLMAPYLSVLLYPWSDVFALFFLLVTLYLFLMLKKFTYDRDVNPFMNRIILFLMGWTSALSFFSKQSYATLVLFLFSFFIVLGFLNIVSWKKTLSSLAIFSAGFFSITALVVYWLFSHQALGDWWIQTIRIGYSNGRIVARSFSRPEILKEMLTNPIWLLFPLSVSFLFVYSLVGVAKRKNNHHLALVFGSTLICLSSILHYYPNFELSHRYWAVTPAIGFFLFWLRLIIGNKRKTSTTMLISFAFVAGSCMFVVKGSLENIVLGMKKVNYPYVTTHNPPVLENMRLSPDEAKYYEEVSSTINNYLQKHADKQFVINTEEALFMTFTDRARNMEPMFANYSGYTSGFYSYDAKFKKFVSGRKPLLMVYEKDKNLWQGYYSLAVWEKNGTVLLAPEESMSK